GKVSAMPGVEYAEPKYIRRLQASTPDPVKNDFETFHSFADAWDIENGSSDVVIAVVDAGMGYTHPELRNKLWINEDEVPSGIHTAADQNGDGNGELTPAEIVAYLENNNGDHNGNGTITLRDALHPDSPFTDGTDTDGNGHADDLYGWDFWEGGGFNGEEVDEDNNPILSGNDHGTHVGGIAAAAHNGIGIAGSGFRSSYMPVKAGGIEDDPDVSGNQSLLIGFGFEGIMYAAENGADIINCSWGGGEFSEAEEDVINFATQMGAVVIGAAGNGGREGVFFPGAYENAMSVGSIETNNEISNYSQFGFKLDVLATGSGVESVGCEGFVGPDCNFQIEQKSGTSMSVPVVSGLAALIKAKYPGWSPQRIAGQIRATATSVSPTDPELMNKLGGGRINAVDALQIPKPVVRITDFEFVNSDDLKLGLREQGSFRFTVTNFGASTGNLAVTVTTLNQDGVELSTTSVQAGALGTDESADLSVSLTITDEFNTKATPRFMVQFSDAATSYDDFRIVEYKNFLYDVMDENGVKMSFAADGTVGFTNPLGGTGGVGFVPRRKVDGSFVDGDNALFEGGLMIETNGEVFDAVRDASGGVSRDFNIRDVFRLTTPSGAQQALEGTASFIIGEPDNPTATITLTSYAFEEAERRNVVYVRYEIENPSSFFELEDLYLGLFNDWDIGLNVGNNAAGYIEQDSILYLQDLNTGSTQPFVAVAHLGAFSSALAIDNAAEGERLNFGLYDDYTDLEKSRSLKAGTEHTSVSGSDVSAVIASGPYTVSAKARISVGFVYAFGEDLDELRSQINYARNNVPFEVSGKGLAVFPDPPSATEVFQNYPNPFNPTTRIRLDLAQRSEVNLSIYNILGKKVAELVDGPLDAQIHIFKFDANNLSSGLYFARLRTDDRVRVLKMVLVK
ncbi:MAG: S8/S53 family peptidase, partial [Balneolaceae bacterium]|nr:S8/S53 family peptidase [Balneolaceae bacterium]